MAKLCPRRRPLSSLLSLLPLSATLLFLLLCDWRIAEAVSNSKHESLRGKAVRLVTRKERLVLSAVQEPTERFHVPDDAFPSYCSKPRELSKQEIPPLQDKTVKMLMPRGFAFDGVMRHGGRTPSLKYEHCWKNYSAKHPPWNCPDSLEVLELGSSSLHAKKRMKDQRKTKNSRSGGTSTNSSSSSSDFKWATGSHTDPKALVPTGDHEDDADSVEIETFPFYLTFDSFARENTFGGTCREGQLLLVGMVQGGIRGDQIFKSYFLPSSTSSLTPLLWAVDERAASFFKPEMLAGKQMASLTPKKQNDLLTYAAHWKLSSEAMRRAREERKLAGLIPGWVDLRDLAHLRTTQHTRTIGTEISAASRLFKLIGQSLEDALPPLQKKVAASIASSSGAKSSDENEESQSNWDKETAVILALNKGVTSDAPFALHTMDYHNDHIYANFHLDPLIGELAKESVNSKEMKEFEKEHQEIFDLLQNTYETKLDRNRYFFFSDCLITEVCAARWSNIPAGLVPKEILPYLKTAGKSTTITDRPEKKAAAATVASSDTKNDADDEAVKSDFDAVWDTFDQLQFSSFKWRNGAMSKVSISRFLTDIKESLKEKVRVYGGISRPDYDKRKRRSSSKTDGEDGNSTTTAPLPEISHLDPLPVPPFSLTATHDTALIPLLAALGIDSEKSPPFAALLMIELYEAFPFSAIDDESTKHLKKALPASYASSVGEDGFYFFRLIYDGQVITPIVEGCELPLEGDAAWTDEVCPLSVLYEKIDRVAFEVEILKKESEDKKKKKKAEERG